MSIFLFEIPPCPSISLVLNLCFPLIQLQIDLMRAGRDFTRAHVAVLGSVPRAPTVPCAAGPPDASVRDRYCYP